MRIPSLALALALAAGIASAGAPATPPARFILLLYEGPAFDSAGSRVAEYRDWAASLRTEGRQVSGDEILPEGTSLPPAEKGDRERLAGFFIVTAADLADATAVGRRCPHLHHGGRVVVRALGG